MSRWWVRNEAEPHNRRASNFDFMTTTPNPHETPLANPAPPAAWTASARSQLLPVALAMLVACILHIYGGLYYFAYIYMTATAPNADPAESQRMIVYGLFYGITMLYCLMLATGAFSMMRRGSYLWALTVCILALVPMLGPCYFLAIPFGIWGLVLLRRADVRNSFARP
jgi:hypothetical protein